MEISIIFKIAALGIVITVLGQVLKHSGREEMTFLLSLAGLVIVLFWIVPSRSNAKAKIIVPQATERSIESSGLSRFKSTAKNTAAIPIIPIFNILQRKHILHCLKQLTYIWHNPERIILVIGLSITRLSAFPISVKSYFCAITYSSFRP